MGRKRKPEGPRPIIIYKGSVPSCTDEETFRGWRAKNSLSRAPYSFCTDCTPERQQRMIGERCCDHPEISFRVTAEGEVQGYLPQR